MRTLCVLFVYGGQSYCKQVKSNAKRRLEEDGILNMVKSYRKKMPRIGGTELRYLLNESGYKIGRKVLYDILRSNRLLVRKRKKYAVTTDSNHRIHKRPNLIGGFDVHRSDLLWVGDITYITIHDGFAYLLLITDAYFHKIMGYKLIPSLENEGCISAWRMSAESTSQNHRVGLIHHSDRGSQYSCKEYVKILNDNNIRISMTEKGNPYEKCIGRTGK